MMSHVKIVDPWETGKPTQIPLGVKVTSLQKGGPSEPFLLHRFKLTSLSWLAYRATHSIKRRL